MKLDIESILQHISDGVDALVKIVTEQRAEPDSCKYTLFDWLSEWEQTYKSPKLRDHGYDLRMNINKHVKPHIENKPLNEYSAHDIQKALSCVPTERMRQIVRQIYDQSFREAARAGYITVNPVGNVEGVKHVYKKGRSLTRAEHAEFLQVTANDRFSALWRFYLLTGARPSEPLSVRQSDISDDTLRIRGTKTSEADRILPVSDKLRKLLGEIPKDCDLLFPSSYRMVLNHFNYHILPQLSFGMNQGLAAHVRYSMYRKRRDNENRAEV